MRRSTILAFVVGGVFGAGGGFAIGLFATGTFIHADPSDPVHYGSGRVTVTERSVFLEADFDVRPGPLYHVYLVTQPEVRRSADVRNAEFVDLGRLRAFQGSQRYAIPPADLARAVAATR